MGSMSKQKEIAGNYITCPDLQKSLISTPYPMEQGGDGVSSTEASFLLRIGMKYSDLQRKIMYGTFQVQGMRWE